MCAQIRFNSACTEISVPIMLSRYDPSSSANNQDKKEQLSEVLLPLDYYYFKKRRKNIGPNVMVYQSVNIWLLQKKW